MGFASQQAAGPFLPSVVTGYLMECFLFYILLPPECSSGPASQLWTTGPQLLLIRLGAYLSFLGGC